MTAPTPPECDPERVETVARALYLDSYGPASPWTWDEIGVVSRAVFRRLAAAAIAALPPSPAEEAVKRVEALATEWGRKPHVLAPHVARVDVARRLLAALASPAPAPQGGGQR